MSKSAAHVQQESDAAAHHLRLALYPAIKCMGNTSPGWLQREVLPEYDACGMPRPFIWRREWVADGQQREWVLEGIAGAHKFFNHTMQAYDDWRELTDVVESINEFIAWSDEDMRWLCEFESEVVRLFHLNGNRVIVGNFSVGWPKLEHWPAYSPVLAQADFLGLHEYAWPEGVDANNGVPFLWHPWRILRYRKARQEILSHGMRLPPIILTEIGWDKAVWQGGHVGFRGAPDPNAYYDWLVNYDMHIALDDDVMFASIFQTGAAPDWQERGFDIVDHYVGRTLAGYTRVAALQGQNEEEDPSANERDVAKAKLAALPATMKWCDERGYIWRMEWRLGDHYYCLAYDPSYGHYVILKGETQTWQVVDEWVAI